MRKGILLVLLLGTGLAYGQYQLPNVGFENWSRTSLYENPDDWSTSNFTGGAPIVNVTKSSDAVTGSFSIRIQDGLIFGDTLFGFAYLGSIGDDGPGGGITYPSPVDLIEGQVKHELALGDTATILVIKYLGGNPVSTDLISFVGNQTAFTSFSFSINSANQDEIFIGLLSANPFSDNPGNPNNYIQFEDLSLRHSILGAGAALPNPSFENWSDVSVNDVDGWETFNELLVGIGDSNVIQTTDAANGMFAARLETKVLNGSDTLPGVLAYGSLSDDFDIGPGPFQGNPTSFGFNYKYAPSGMDSAGVFIQVYSNGNIIGGAFQTLPPAASYSPVNLPLLIVGQPDSASVIFFAGDNAGSMLTLDDAKFSGGNVGIPEFTTLDVHLFPNPAKIQTYIRLEEAFTGNLEVVDLYGRMVYADKLNEVETYSIPTQNLPIGNYIVRVSNAREMGFVKLQVIR